MKQSFTESVQQVINEAHSLLDTLNLEEVSEWLYALSSIWTKRRIFFWARGRSFLILRGFAMRLMHMGYQIHIVGEVDCPSIEKDDVLVVASGRVLLDQSFYLPKRLKNRRFGCSNYRKTGTPLHTLCNLVVEFHPEMILSRSNSMQMEAVHALNIP